MPVTKLVEDLPINSDGKINRADIFAKAMNNVRDKNNLHNTENTSFIYVKDIDKNILVGKDALRHGLMRNSKDTAKVTTKIGDVLENAIKVNELKPRNNTLGGYVLMGIGIDDKGNYYPTRIIVNNYEVQKIEPLDVVYAVRTKKKNQSPNGAGFASKETPLSKGSSEISVSDFLDIVKENFADTLPRDVLEKYNTKRPKSALSESVKYSIKESDYDKIENRLMGDDLLNAYDTIEEIRNVGGKVDENGYAYVYHNTSKDNAENIRKTGVMSAKEDSIFVSTKPDGQSEFDISSDISYNDIKGKSFLLIYDNSTTGRTFKGLEGFIEDNGGKVVGYYAMTTGQDMSEKMITTDETWEKLKQFGIEKIRNFAESEGIRREISRNGLTERETRELIRQYRKKVDKRGIDSFMSKNEGTQAEIQRVYENGRRDSEKDRTRGKFSLKNLNNGSFDKVENNTTNVQIKSDNFKNWFGDWENDPSKASKVVNEDGTPKVVYGTQNNLTIDSNAVVSIFGKDNAITKQLKNALIDEANNKTSMFYWNKKEALSLLQRPGLRLPNPLPQDGFIHNITEKNSSVKPKIKNATYSQQFKRWFGDWENNPKKASKVVNEDGTPKAVYHGTDKGGFYVFDPKMSDDKISLFFFDSKVTSNSYAQSDNQQLYEVYLAKKKPYVIDAKGHMWNELDDKY